MAIRAYSAHPLSYDSWQAETAYVQHDYIVPTTPDGYRYECETPGRSGETEPGVEPETGWNNTPGESTLDGTVLWICREIPNSLTVTLDTGGHGGLAILEVWVKCEEEATFDLYGSHDGVDGTWRWMDDLSVPHKGREEHHEGYLNAYRHIKIETDSEAECEAEIVAGEM